MKKIYILLLVVFSCLSFTANANAKGIGMFGGKESIHKIQDLQMPGENGESLYLANKTKTYFFILGVYMKDEGYVIGINGNSDAYYPMPTGEELKAMQSIGLLPQQLPEYHLSLFDYVFGFSLWIFIIGLIIYTKAKQMLFERE